MKIELLSVEEAKKLSQEILQCKAPKNYDGYINEGNGNCCWWLRSPGNDGGVAAVVGLFGGIFEFGNFVSDEDNAVRPIIHMFDYFLITNGRENTVIMKRAYPDYVIDTLEKDNDGYIYFLGTKWIDISDYLGYPCLLKKKCLKKAHRFDGKSNNYDQSEIKKFIEDWYRRKVKKCYGKE